MAVISPYVTHNDIITASVFKSWSFTIAHVKHVSDQLPTAHQHIQRK